MVAVVKAVMGLVVVVAEVASVYQYKPTIILPASANTLITYHSKILKS